MILQLLTDLTALRDDLRELIAAHLELVRMEVRQGARQTITFAVIVVVSGIALTVGLALLALVAADALPAVTGWSQGTCRCVLGGSLVVAGAAAALVAYLHLRRTFRGFQKSMEQLREDAIWIEEMGATMGWRRDGRADQ